MMMLNTRRQTSSMIPLFVRSSRRRVSGVTCSTGAGFLGALGHGDWVDRDVLEVVRDDVGTALRSRRVSAGWGHTAAIDDRGEVLVWGRAMDAPSQVLRISRLHSMMPLFAQIANAGAIFFAGGTGVASGVTLAPMPLELPLGEDEQAVGVFCGAGTTAVWTNKGRGFLVGNNSYGQCATAECEAILMPEAPIKIDGHITQIALGFRHGVALTNNGRIWSWGKNDNGQLGNGSSEPSIQPTSVVGIDDRVTHVAAGLTHSSALTETGDVYVWGKMRGTNVMWTKGGLHEGLAILEDALVPRKLDPTVGAKINSIACSNFHTVATDGRRVFCTGFEATTRRMVPELKEVTGLPHGGRKWTIAGGITAVAIYDDEAAYTATLAENAATATRVHNLEPPTETALLDVTIGWKHTLATLRQKKPTENSEEVSSPVLAPAATTATK